MVTDKGSRYYPEGSQNGKVLRGSFANLYFQGSSDYPNSNSYRTAVGMCMFKCDLNLACRSFNVITIVKEDFNNCIPTFICRFSSRPYDPRDYFDENDRNPSYVWSIREPPAPNCTTNKGEYASPLLWQNRGLDDYLSNLARNAGLGTSSSDFALGLMSELGVNSYACLDDTITCPIPNLNDNKCLTWVDRQISIFQTYMHNNEEVLSYIVNQISLTGFPIFNSLWRERTPYSSFDTRSLLEGIIDAALGAFPEIGQYLYLIAVVVQDVIDNVWPENPPIEEWNPDKRDTWSEYIAQYANYISDARKGLSDRSRAVMQSPALL